MAARNVDIDNVNIQITKRRKFLHNIPSEDSVFKFDFITLKNITRAKIIISLWMDTEIQNEITNLMKCYRRVCCMNLGTIVVIQGKWKKIQNFVSKKVSQLCLPKIIIHELIDIIEPIGDAIRKWIIYLDYFIFETIAWRIFGECENITIDSNYSSKKCFAVDYIEKIKWTSRGRIDYQQTVRSILAEVNSSLSDDCKYKLACNFCLEDILAVVAPNVITPNYLNSVDIEQHPMVHYWTSYVTETHISVAINNSRIQRSLYDGPERSKNEFIMSFLIYRYSGFPVDKLGSMNEVAIKYIWNKLCEEEKGRVLRLLAKASGNYDIPYFLLSNLCFERQQEFFQKNSCDILRAILNDWFLEEQFLPTAFFLFNVMNSGSYFKILYMIVLKINDFAFEKKRKQLKHIAHWKLIFKQLWRKAPQHLTQSVVVSVESLQELTLLLSWENYIDIIELLLTDVPLQQRKEVIFTSFGIASCVELIIRGQWDSLNIIECTLFSEEDRSQLKQRIVQESGCYIVNVYKQQNARDKMEYFLNWAFISDEQKKQFKEHAFPVHSISTRRSTLFRKIL